MPNQYPFIQLTLLVGMLFSGAALSGDCPESMTEGCISSQAPIKSELWLDEGTGAAPGGNGVSHSNSANLGNNSASDSAPANNSVTETQNQPAKIDKIEQCEIEQLRLHNVEKLVARDSYIHKLEHCFKALGLLIPGMMEHCEAYATIRLHTQLDSLELKYKTALALCD